MTQLIVVDPTKCTGCQACEATCSIIRTGESNPDRSRINIIRFPEQFFFYPLVCQQCERPSCAAVCPTNALTKNGETGVVEMTESKCIGCKLCLTACPFGAMIWLDTKPAKCDLCGGDPACVKLCEPQAIKLGEPKALTENRRIAMAAKVKGTYLSEEITRS